MTQPVFVDGSGRRARWFARLCWALGTLVCVYITLVVVALVAPPGVARLGLGPLLPKPDAPALTDSRGGRLKPREALEPSAQPSQSGLPRASSTGRTGPGQGAPASSQPVPGGTRRSPHPGPTSGSSPTAAPTPHGRSSDHPTQSPHPHPTPTPRTTPPGRP